MRSSCCPRTGSIRCPTWRGRPMAAPGRTTCAAPFAPERRRASRSIPTAPRIFEEIDRLAIGENGRGQSDLARADSRFLPRAAAGRIYQGPRRRRSAPTPVTATSRPNGAARDFFPYRPRHLNSQRAAAGPRAHRPTRCSACSRADAIVGAIWTQGSPRIEETIYWLNLLIDTTVPICGNAAQRTHGQVSEDGSEEPRRFRRLHHLARLGRRGRPQPRRHGAHPGAADLRRARRAEGGRAAGRLRHDRRAWRHPRRGRA